MEIMLKNKNGFQVNISLSIFFIAFCDLFTDFPSYLGNLVSYDKERAIENKITNFFNGNRNNQ
jgi:hypothetical protein